MLKVGLIGCGGIGTIHAECWLAMGENVQLTAIADVSLERAKKYADRSGAKIYENALDMLNEEVLDVVDICVPTFLHAEYAVYAMEKVPNVIVEKPACLNEAQAQQLLEAQERTGAFVQVAHVVRFTDAYAYLKDVVDSRQYGKVIAGNFSRISPRPMWMKGHDDVNRTGSMALDMHIHDADYIRYLMGRDPESVYSRGIRDREGIIQHIWTSYGYGDALLVAEGSWDYPVKFPFAATFRVRLEKAALVFDKDGILTVYPEEGEKFVPILSPKNIKELGINVPDLGPYLKELRYFVEMMENGNRRGIATLSEAIASCKLVWEELKHFL